MIHNLHTYTLAACTRTLYNVTFIYMYMHVQYSKISTCVCVCMYMYMYMYVLCNQLIICSHAHFTAGLKVLLQRFPQGFISGHVPASCIQSPPGSARSRKPLSSSSQQTPSSSTSKKPIPPVSSVVHHREKFSLEGTYGIVHVHCTCICKCS